jgi:hypothetical protein
MHVRQVKPITKLIEPHGCNFTYVVSSMSALSIVCLCVTLEVECSKQLLLLLVVSLFSVNLLRSITV